MKEVLVTGSRGQLGRELEKVSGLFPDLNLHLTDLPELDVTSRQDLENFLSANRIDCLVNCAAYTAVDKAETDITKATRLNAEAPALLAEMAARFDLKLIHISTDYVYECSYTRPITETDNTIPLSVYGKTKLAGDHAILQSSADAIILRTSWLYSGFGHNFVKTIIRLAKEKDEIKVVNDQYGTPTWAADLAHCILYIIDNYNISGREIYNYSNEGICSWYEFAKAIVGLLKSECRVIPVSSAEYPQIALRPANSVLDKSKIKLAFQISIPTWEISLERCLNDMETII